MYQEALAVPYRPLAWVGQHHMAQDHMALHITVVTIHQIWEVATPAVQQCRLRGVEHQPTKMLAFPACLEWCLLPLWDNLLMYPIWWICHKESIHLEVWAAISVEQEGIIHLPQRHRLQGVWCPLLLPVGNRIRLRTWEYMQAMEIIVDLGRAILQCTNTTIPSISPIITWFLRQDKCTSTICIRICIPICISSNWVHQLQPLKIPKYCHRRTKSKIPMPCRVHNLGSILWCKLMTL
mmetsp:Transcript_52092/g.86841  ORF Transcript_52092/g.86841 Transcript_52092/m.86841 type:complete len:237 (+) Transcript_52092:2041-2751(+)